MKAGPRALHVPEMDGRYYSVQFTDPITGANLAYFGKRTTGTAAGDFLLCEPGWKGDVPTGVTRIDVPHRSALRFGRVFAADENDRRAADAFANHSARTAHNRAWARFSDSSQLTVNAPSDSQ